MILIYSTPQILIVKRQKRKKCKIKVTRIESFARKACDVLVLKSRGPFITPIKHF